MCGVVGYCGVGADLEVLTRAAAEAASRGPHSFGWSWWDGERWTHERGPGPLPAPPDDVAGVKVALGHSRLATTGERPGDAPDPAEGQPLELLPADGRASSILLAHNGNVPGAETVVDSLELLERIGERRRLLDLRGAALVATGELCPDATVALVATWSELVTVRLPGADRPPHPLHELRSPTHRYLCSRPFDPGCVMVPEGVHRVC